MKEYRYKGTVTERRTGHKDMDEVAGNVVTELSTGKTFIVDLNHFDENTRLVDVLIEVDPKTIEAIDRCEKISKPECEFKGQIVDASLMPKVIDFIKKAAVSVNNRIISFDEDVNRKEAYKMLQAAPITKCVPWTGRFMLYKGKHPVGEVTFQGPCQEGPRAGANISMKIYSERKVVVTEEIVPAW